MKRFLILFNSSQTAREGMDKASPDRIKASMNEWMQWKDDLSDDVTFEWGLPLEHAGRIDNTGIIPGDTQTSGYAIIEGESRESISQLLQTHPHLKLPDATIDLFEMLSMSSNNE